jgi:rhodanese-related sulfurtransferase
MVRRIDLGELMLMCRAGERFTLIDVLPVESYEREHIPGAISLPLSEIDRGAAEIIGKGSVPVVYCASFECTASTLAARKLEALGLRNVMEYKGGLKEYREAGFPLEGSAHEGVHCASCCTCH